MEYVNSSFWGVPFPLFPLSFYEYFTSMYITRVALILIFRKKMFHPIQFDLFFFTKYFSKAVSQEHCVVANGKLCRQTIIFYQPVVWDVVPPVHT